jgi:hypothetical protein
MSLGPGAVYACAVSPSAGTWWKISRHHTMNKDPKVYLDTALLRTRKSVLCSSVRIRVRVGCSALVVSIERT